MLCNGEKLQKEFVILKEDGGRRSSSFFISGIRIYQAKMRASCTDNPIDWPVSCYVNPHFELSGWGV
jgi:hypothetical protein